MNEIDYSVTGPQTKPIYGEAPKVSPPAQGADSSEYICGNSGAAFEGHTAGRDQDRSRRDEMVPAQGCSRYVD